MKLSFHSELSKLSITKKFLSFIPEQLRFRFAKARYNYESPDINGIDIVAPIQNDGLVCLVNTKDIIGWKIFFFGEYELGTNRILKKHLKEDFTVIEAGANIGSETLIISKLLTKGKIYCFEPNPIVFERLKINISINELNNVAVYDIALGESDEPVHFNIYPKGFCNQGMSSKYLDTPQTKKITVVQKTLDSFVIDNNIRSVDFIKMDIQGAEIDLIKGSIETIKNFRPAILTEADHYFSDIKVLYEMISSFGYDIYLINDQDTRKINSVNEVKDGNWLAFPAKI